MSDLETLKAQHPCIEGVLKVYADAGPDGCSQRERAMVDLLALVQQHEATIQDLKQELEEADEALILSYEGRAGATFDSFERTSGAYQAALARHSARAQQDKSEAKKEE